VKLLISAYGCEPNRGSEYAVGWNWATEAHRLGHEVCVLVSPVHRDAIAAAVREDVALKEIRWVFPEPHYWSPKWSPKWWRTYYLLWQKAALRVGRGLHHEIGFDVVHHLTWGGVRAATFLGSLGPPLIIGPTGGGETSPRSLRDEFRFRDRILEVTRDLSNSTININPLIRSGIAAAAVIFVKTADTRALFIGSVRQKTVLFIELGIQKEQLSLPRMPRQTPPTFLYAGRLLYWKGVHIAVQAFAHLSKRMPQARFTIVGSGPEEARLKSDILAYDLKERVDFISWLPQSRLFELYESHDLLLFPSLHDSSGGVVLEALARGMPVICLDLGGPKEIVTPNSGVIVKTSGLNTAQLASHMADEICNLFASPTTLATLSAGAVARAHEFLFPERVAQFYRKAWKIIEERGGSGSKAAKSRDNMSLRENSHGSQFRRFNSRLGGENSRLGGPRNWL
jgi:glycosyltransferase involved in cell wall biosynthesis